MSLCPSVSLERSLASSGHLVIGVDEVGCGCLAGPVVAAAVHLPISLRITGIRDSKLLSPEKRLALFKKFLHYGVSFGIGMASVEEVDTVNIRNASLLAMQRAVEAFGEKATYVLVDAWKIPRIKLQQRGIIHGDRLVRCIAAASIIAKVARDRLMKEFDSDFPQYAFARHKGYGTALHQRLLKKHGASVIHRKTFLKSLAL